MQQLLSALHRADGPTREQRNVSELKERPQGWALYVISGGGERWTWGRGRAAERPALKVCLFVCLCAERPAETERHVLCVLAPAPLCWHQVNAGLCWISGAKKPAGSVRTSWLWSLSQQQDKHIFSQRPRAQTGLGQDWKSAGGQWSVLISGRRLVCFSDE